MKKINTHRYLARVTIEFTTPFHIGTGSGDLFSDAAVVCDANGLPALPGSSLAGVLRAAYTERHDNADKVFGYQNGREGSRLTVSWGCIHNAAGVPVDGCVAPETFASDDVLGCAMVPTLRDHVKINHRGVSDVEVHGKFDELVVCAGHRFTFELELTGDETDRETWDRIKQILAADDLRIGGHSRRGLGAFRIVNMQTGIFDLRKDLNSYISHPAKLSEKSVSLKDEALSSTSGGDALKVTLMLEPHGYWMFGGGVDRATDKGNSDMSPVRDRRVVWEGNKGKVERDCLVIPGSSVKGAIAHRVAFHFNAIKGFWADKIDAQQRKRLENENPAVKQLFGYCLDHDRKEDEAAGQRGNVLIDDIFIDDQTKQQLLHHVSIDRFTGGARSGFLFSERPVWKSARIPLVLTLKNRNKLDPEARKALIRTITDLCSGRLQLGAGSGRGHGFFSAVNVKWSDNGVWQKEQEA